MGELVELPDEVVEIVSQPEFRLITLLKRHDFRELLMVSHQEAAAIVANRAGEFVRKFCFPPKSATVTFRNVMLKILKKNPCILDALLRGNELYNVAQEVFGKGDGEAVRALSQICGKVLWRDRHRFCNCCGFLFQFLGFIHIPWVASLFIALVAKRDDNADVQQWLIDNLFIRLLAKVLVMQKEDDPPEKFENALSVITVAMESENLLEVFKTKDVVEGLKWKIGKYPKHVEAERWMALRNCYSQELAESYHDLLDIICGIVTEIDDSIYVYHVAALDMLSLMLESDGEIRKRLMTSCLHVSLIRLLTKFPEHSNYHVAFVRFAASVLRSPIISELWGALMLSQFSDWLSGQEHTLLVETCLAVFEVADDLASTDQNFQKSLESLPSVAACICLKVRPRVEDVNAGYGGKVPKVSEKDRLKGRKNKALKEFMKRMADRQDDQSVDDKD